MNSAWRTFKNTVVVLCGAAALVVPGINVAVDPYEVFGTGLLRPGSTLNERVVKSRILLGAARFDTLIVGSSVAGVIDPKLLSDGGRSYNLSFFSATPHDILRMLQLLERAGLLPKRLYVGLDPFMFTRPVPGAPQMRMPPGTDTTGAWTFWRDYLFAASVSGLVAKISEQLAASPGVRFDLDTGAYELPNFERAIAQDPERYARVKVDEADIPLPAGWWHAPAGRDLRELVEWSRRQPDLAVTWFLQPLHWRMRHVLGEDGDLFLSNAHRIVGPSLIDLSQHPISGDTRLWYEAKHYRPAAAADVVAALRSPGAFSPQAPE